MRDEFHKLGDGTTLWRDDGKHYYDNGCYPNVRLIRDDNYFGGMKIIIKCTKLWKISLFT